MFAIRRKLIGAVIINTLILGYSTAIPAQVLIEDNCLVITGSQYSAQTINGQINLYSQFYQGNCATTSSSNVVIVKRNTRPTTVIIVPSHSAPLRVRSPKPIIHPVTVSPARQCGGALLGSPIAAPIPVDIYGKPCSR
jgi:hypothetical protein